MSLATRIKRLNYALQIQRGTRDIYYRVIEVQLRAGLSLENAVINADVSLGKRNPLAKLFGKLVAKEAFGGKSITEIWKDSMALPLLDSQLLVMGERRNSLPDTLNSLSNFENTPTTVWANVIKPNLYSLATLIVALIFLFNFSTFLEILAGRYPEVLERQMSYNMSIWLQNWYWIFLMIIGGTLISIKLLNELTVGNFRRRIRILLVFYESNFAIQFLRIAKRFADEGASFVETTGYAKEIFAGKHVQRTLTQIENQLLQGSSFLSVIKGTVIPTAIGDTIESLAPNNDRALLPQAYYTGEIILTEQLRMIFTSINVIVRGIGILGATILIGFMVMGMYDTSTDMTQEVTRHSRSR